MEIPMSFRPDLLNGRAALVTGGGTGICRGIALALAAHGCDVAITSRRREHLEPTLAELGATGRRAIAEPADVRDSAAVDRVIAATMAGLGRLDIRVNGAAPGPIEGTEGVRRLTTEHSRDSAVRGCPLGRLGTIDDIANAALFLCSGAASFVNGVTLVVDGGLWLRSARILGE